MIRTLVLCFASWICVLSAAAVAEANGDTEEMLLIPVEALSFLSIRIYARNDPESFLPSADLIDLLGLTEDEQRAFVRTLNQADQGIRKLMQDRIAVLERTGDSVEMEMKPLGTAEENPITDLHEALIEVLGEERVELLSLVSQRFWPREGKHRRLHYDYLARRLHGGSLLYHPTLPVHIHITPLPDRGPGWWLVDCEVIHEQGFSVARLWNEVTRTHGGGLLRWLLNNYLPE